MRKPTRTYSLGLQNIELADVHESPWNPRKSYDPAELKGLTESIRQQGILTPLLARPRAEGGVELAAGHRRRRAALALGVTTVPVLVRDLDDVAFVEAMTAENLQRADVPPLEEAEGFRALMERAGYDVARLAARVGKHPATIRARLRLLTLTPEFQDLLRAGDITLAQAGVLVTLPAASQQKVWQEREQQYPQFWVSVDPDLFAEETRSSERRVLLDAEELRNQVNLRFAVSPTDPDLPDLFPETYASVKQATADGTAVVRITTLSYSDEKGIKSTREWRPATQQACAHMVVGVVAFGARRGEAFPVCCASTKCATHWAKEIAAAAKAKQREDAARVTPATKRDSAAAKAAEEKARQERERREWERQVLLGAAARKLHGMDAGALNKALKAWLELTSRVMPGDLVNKLLPSGKTLDTTVRHLLLASYDEEHHNPDLAEVAGLDYAKTIAAAEKAEAAAKAAKTKAPAKAKAKVGKKGGRS